MRSTRQATRSPNEQRVDLAIDGMTCASCVSHVTRALRKVDGVHDVSVNLATEQAEVLLDPGVADAQLIAAVQSAGYAAHRIAMQQFAQDDEDARERDRATAGKRRLLIFALGLFIPTLAIAMFAPAFIGKNILLLALSIPVWAIVGWQFHRGAIAQARHGSANMDTLVSLGSTAALLYSVYATIVGIAGYQETASAIVTLIFLGKYLETSARGRSNAALRALLALRPQRARVRDADGSERTVEIESLRIGDRLVVAAGERIPVDGTILEGASSIDASMLTGEPIPVEAASGEIVRAGTLNGDGTLLVRADAVGAGTMLARIVELVRRAQGSTPPIQRIADRVAGVFVPVIIGIAIITFLGWWLSGHGANPGLIAAVAVLVVACPCALGLATPMAIIVGVGVAARDGILIKDAQALEELGGVSDVIFDKTGTLTQGRPQVVGMATQSATTENELLGLAAGLERGSTHPLASAILAAVQARGIEIPSVADGQTIRGSGLRGTLDGDALLVGTEAFLRDAGIEMTVPLAALPLQATRVYVARAGRFVGVIALADQARENSAQAVTQLRSLGINVHLVTGDALEPARAIGDSVGIQEISATANPQEKAHYVTALRAPGRRVAFVGDGINDAPALASADVGIAMGSGSAIALETAKAAILSNDPRGVARAIRLSRATMHTIRINLFWAFGYNVVLVPLAAFGRIEPIWAAAAMALSSLFVVGNSLLLRLRR